MKSIWKEIRNHHVDEMEEKVYIDAYRTADPDEEGKVIAKVDLKAAEVEYLDERAKTDELAQEFVRETVKNVKEGEYRPEE